MMGTVNRLATRRQRRRIRRLERRLGADYPYLGRATWETAVAYEMRLRSALNGRYRDGA
jgi:hypothetical protein